MKQILDLYVVVLGLILLTVSNLAQESEDPASDLKEHDRQVEHWVRQLSEAEPSAVLEQLKTIESFDVQRETAATLILNRVHANQAALGLLFCPGWFDEFDIDFGPEIQSAIIPTLLDWLEGDVLPEFQRAAGYLQRVDVIPDTWAARIRELASHDNPYTRVEACHLISKLQAPSNIDLETLITCLDDPDKFVRKSALQAAAEIGSPLLLQAVRKNLRHFDDNVQIEAAKAVLQLDNNDAEPIRVLENLYFNRNIPTTRSDVLYAIADLDSRVLQAPKVLLSALDAPSEMRSMTFFQYDTGMYVEALEALAACGQQSLGAIGNWLADDSTTLRVRVRLLELLSESEWNAKELRPIIEKHVLSDDVSVRKPALLILRNIGDVNADLVIDHLNGGAGVRQAAAIALGNVSAATRSSAINALIALLQDESLAVRIAAARSFLSLNDDSAPAVESLIGLIPNLAELGWEDFNALQAIIEQLRPSPQKLIAKLLAAAQERDEQSRAVTLLGSMDASAFDARVSLLAHSNGSTRASALSQLGNSGEARAVPHIVKHLSDHGKYDVSISIDMGFESEVRIAAIEALSAPGLDVESIIPLLMERLQEGWSRSFAAKALGQAGPAAHVALPELHALEIKEPSDESLQIATAIARLETDPQRQTIGYEKLFQLIASPGFCLQEPNGTDFERTLVQLADSGRPLFSLKERLVFLATTHDCLRHSWRIRAACALAVLDSENPQWRRMLEHGKTLERFGSGEATSGLELLEERTK